MHDIICPHCNTAFKVDEAGYADILKQVRDREFEQQLNKRLALAEQDKRNAIELAVAKKDREMQTLEAQLKQSAMHQELAIKDAVNKAESSAIALPLSSSRFVSSRPQNYAWLKPNSPKKCRR